MLFLLLLSAIGLAQIENCSVSLSGSQQEDTQFDLECAGPGEREGQINWKKASGTMTVHMWNRGSVGNCRKLNIIRSSGAGEIWSEGDMLATLDTDFIEFKKEPVIDGNNWVMFQLKADGSVPDNKVEVEYTMQDWPCLGERLLSRARARSVKVLM